MPRFHVLSGQVTSLFIYFTSLPSWDRSKINKAMAKTEKGHGNGEKSSLKQSKELSNFTS